MYRLIARIKEDLSRVRPARAPHAPPLPSRLLRRGCRERPHPIAAHVQGLGPALLSRQAT